MRQFLLAVLASWLLHFTVAKPDPMDVLLPLPRHAWDTSFIAKRDDTNTSVGLQSQEQFMWTSSNSRPLTIKYFIHTDTISQPPSKLQLLA
jgi:hypothetical protein